ncbi:hypothetical protein [Aquimarina rhabdastrellae]
MNLKFLFIVLTFVTFLVGCSSDIEPTEELLVSTQSSHLKIDAENLDKFDSDWKRYNVLYHRSLFPKEIEIVRQGIFDQIPYLVLSPLQRKDPYYEIWLTPICGGIDGCPDTDSDVETTVEDDPLVELLD